MTNLINEAQRMQHLAGILAESQLKETEDTKKPQSESLDNLDEIVDTVLEKLRSKEEVNELFGLFGGNKEKKSAPKVLRVYWELEQGALETVGSGVYYPNTPKGRKDFELWSNDLRQSRDNVSRSNSPNQKFNCIRLKSPKVTDVYLTTKEVPYEKGMKVYTDAPSNICGPENDIRFYSHEDIMNGKMK